MYLLLAYKSPTWGRCNSHTCGDLIYHNHLTAEQLENYIVRLTGKEYEFAIFENGIKVFDQIEGDGWDGYLLYPENVETCEQEKTIALKKIDEIFKKVKKRIEIAKEN